MKRTLDIGLITMLLCCIAAMFLANEDPSARDAWCRFSNFCPFGSSSKPFNKIIYDLAVGSFVTILFYYLVVRLPAYQQRYRMRRGLEQQYRLFRLDCIATILAVTDGTYDSELPSQLLDQVKFRSFFKEKVSDDQERWHRFLNGIDEHHFRKLLIDMEVFRDEVLFPKFDTSERVFRAFWRAGDGVSMG